jgi:hypothetical protein
VQFTNKYVRWRFVFGNDADRAKKEDTYGVLPLVISVKRLFRRAFIVLIVAVLLSVYALSGQKLLSARDAAIVTLKDVDEKIAIIESHSQSVPVNPALREYLRQSKEGNVNVNSNNQAPLDPDPITGDLAKASKANALSVGTFFLCDNVDMTNPNLTDANTYSKITHSFGPITTGTYYYYGSAEQIEICKLRRRTLTQLFAIGEELVSWQRIATNPIQIFFPLSVRVHESTVARASAGPVGTKQSPKPGAAETSDSPNDAPSKATPERMQADHVNRNETTGQECWSYLLRSTVQVLEEFTSAPAHIFGKNDAVPIEFAASDNICRSVIGTAGQVCWIRLSEISEYDVTIPENILSCVTLYILPCLYGFLGAAVAALRYLRVQVDNHWLSFTDRGRIIQTQIPGVVMGSIVGLFAAYITSSNQSFGALSVSAFAFLAGYNLTSLLSLFDDLSGRLFQKAAAASK